MSSSSVYRCAACGHPASLVAGLVVRTCTHTGPVVAELQATVYGQSQVR